MTSLLRELMPLPKRSAASRISTSRPRSARARAVASPTTPAPITTTSTRSMRAKCKRSPYNGLPEETRVSAVHYRADGDVAVLEIANPPVNALSLPVREGLMEGLARAYADENIVAVVVCGAD